MGFSVQLTCSLMNISTVSVNKEGCDIFDGLQRLELSSCPLNMFPALDSFFSPLLDIRILPQYTWKRRKEVKILTLLRLFLVPCVSNRG